LQLATSGDLDKIWSPSHKIKMASSGAGAEKF